MAACNVGNLGKESACNVGILGPWSRKKELDMTDQLNNINLLLVFYLEEGMPPTPGFLPGESPWTEEPGGFQSTGSHRVGHD